MADAQKDTLSGNPPIKVSSGVHVMSRHIRLHFVLLLDLFALSLSAFVCKVNPLI